MKLLIIQLLASCYLISHNLYIFFLSTLFDHAVAQAISHCPLAVEAWVCNRVILCVICGEQSATGSCFSLSSSIFPWHHNHIPSGGRAIGQLVAVVERHSLTPLTWTTPCFRTTSIYALRLMSGTLFHTHIKHVKITVWYILSFEFVARRWEDRWFSTEWQVAFLELDLLFTWKWLSSGMLHYVVS
jgi:hypothetical protein